MKANDQYLKDWERRKPITKKAKVLKDTKAVADDKNVKRKEAGPTQIGLF